MSPKNPFSFTAFLLAMLLLLVSPLNLMWAQSPGVEVIGRVLEAESQQPLPYATVVAKADSQTVLTGTTTGEDGLFSLKVKAQEFYVEVRFMGYETQEIRDFTVERGRVNLGDISLVQIGSSIDEVEIRAEKSTTEFRLDKRVFNVGQDLSSTGMGALEVLNNVPSVTVNIEGQVSLRGNPGVQILINGKPSVLADEESNALGTITADMIEKIEVITNPSAKYEAEGTAGIINIVLKKEDKKGLNGSISLNTGLPHNHSVGISLNRRTERFNFFTQIGAGYRSLPRYQESINQDLTTGNTLYTDGIAFRNEQFYNITLGSDYYINEYNVLTLSGNFAYEIERQPSETDFINVDGDGYLTSRWLRTETTSATNPKWQYDLQYKKQFRDNEDHVLLASALGKYFGKNLSSEFENETLLGSNEETNQRTQTAFNRADYTFKIDYTHPFNDKFTLETGSQYDLNDVGNNFAVFNRVNEAWVADSGFTNNFSWNQKVLGVYTTGAYEGKKWGLKLGLRVENTDLNTLLATTDEANSQNYTNLFPSGAASYKLTDKISMMAGYSRRVFRPRLWDLNPFFNIRNNYNIRQGNPNLQPEFSDSYEISSIFIFDKFSLNSSIYHLFTSQNIERVSTFRENVNITMPMNIGTRNKTGLEVNSKWFPAKWITLSGDLNYGFFVRQGEFNQQNFDFSGTQWTSRLNSKFKLPADIDLELTGNYESGFKTVQGTVSGFAYLDAGIRKKFGKGKAILNFSVRDVFASRIRENIRTQPTFYLYDFSQRGRFFTLNFSYGFGKGEAMTYSGRRR
jgi:outer membrane receptor protein involved in Fe transport